MSTQLLVLLLALVMEDQDLLTASLLDDLAGYQCPRARRQHAACLGRNRQHVTELHPAILVFLRFHPDHVARGNTILLSTCADHRVHKLSLGCAVQAPLGLGLCIRIEDGRSAHPCRDSRPWLSKPSAARQVPIVCLLFSRNGL